MIINHNMNALNAHRMMTSNTVASGKSMEKLSSGSRINRAGDDAAGLAISEKMRSQIRGLDQASRNSQDAISMVQTAEGALNETQSILQRMRELSVQSSTDTNTVDDRQAIQDEINQLSSEINRIGNTTEFNGMKVLNGDKSDAKSKGTKEVMQSGDVNVNFAKGVTWTNDTKGKFEVTSDGTAAGIDFTGAAGDFDWTKLKNGVANTISVEKSATDGTFKVDFTGEDGDGDKLVINAEQMVLDGDTYKYDNHGIKFEIAKSEFDKVADGAKVSLDLVAGATAVVDVDAANQGVSNDWTSAGDATDATKQVTLNATKIAVADSNKRLEGATQIKISGTGSMADATGVIKVELLGKDGTTVISTEEFTNAAANKFQGSSFNYDANGISFQLDFGAAMAAEGFELKMDIGSETKSLGTTDESATFQVGANKDQSMSLSFDDMRASALGIVGTGTGFSSAANVTDGTSSTLSEKALDVTTQDGSNTAIDVLDKAIKTVSQERSKYGSVQNRLEHTINNLNTSSENLTAAESRIRDVDMAKEMLEFSKNNILNQAAQAMLAQAKQAPQGVLQLLR